MKGLRKQPGFIMTVNFLMLMAVYMLSRWFFFYANIHLFQDVTLSDLLTISWGGLRFDISALLFLNLLCILLQFIPFKWRDTVRYQKIVKYIFIFINSLGIVVNMADVVYFEFGGRRTTSIIFSEFGSESNLGTILLNSLTNYWITWLFGVAMIITVILLYYNPIKSDRPRTAYPPNKVYYPIHTALFVLVTVLTIGGIRGGFGLKMHPIRQDSATIYCKKPLQAGIVLNTPFTLLSTMSITGYKDPHFFPEETLDSLFNPIKNQIPKGGDMQRLNVVVFILESFSMEYFGFFNKDKDNGHYQGYTPFLDSLLEKSYSFQYSFANGIRSVDSMPATFAGIPRYIEPYCYYLYASNTLQGLPEMLRREGYITAFFHGAPNTTLGFKGFTNAIGFESYYGMDEYGNNQDFDGTWAIFDEPYLKYFAEKSNEIASKGAPFFLTVFTASSHEPFRIPDHYKTTFARGDNPMHKTICYADFSIKQYFEQVKDKFWFNNTIFIFTADHCGPSYREDYRNEMGHFLIPIFFYTPGGQLPARCDTTRLIQQIDITPSLLSLLNYQKPYFSFGKDVFDASPTFVNYAFNDWNGLSMYYLDDLMIEYKDNSLVGIYEYQKDFSLKHNLLKRKDQYPQLPFMQQQMEAIIQQYVTRMKNNDLRQSSYQ